MAKIKLTKNELKLQRDALKRFERYLPTLQLKKHQLQLEVRQTRDKLAALEAENAAELSAHAEDLALFAGVDPDEVSKLLQVKEWQVGARNVAGTEVPVFAGLTLERPDYDLFATPLWQDAAIELVAHQTEMRLKHQLITEQLNCIESELRVVTQRVNLFEKVKIPDAEENIRRINIYIGDQQTNSVGRSKIAKAKCLVRDAELQ